MKDKQEYIAEGFSFSSLKDAKLAEQERKKIEYLEAHMDYDYPEDIFTVYEKAIEERVFKTPAGIVYLRHLQTYLCEQPEIDTKSVPAIPLYDTYEKELREKPEPAKVRVQGKNKKKNNSQRLTISVILNIGLIIAVIAMFSLAMKSDEPNILNYERAIQDKYASWEQELKEREQTVRDKEREMKLEAE